jgi:DNA polymerase I-like protein with 3'-5' exonuclease and polymerase domains
MLESWGYRLGEYKGDFSPGDYTNHDTLKPHTWKSIGFVKEMDEYGRQDVEVTLKLIEKIESKNYSQECLDLEHAVATILFKQHERGWAFDTHAAEKLAANLQHRHAEIAAELQKLWQPWYAAKVSGGTALFVPKRDNKKDGYTGGAPLSKVHQVVFNPASRDHIADRLTKTRNWRPRTFTAGGKPQVDETVLGALPWPEARVLSEYLLIEKRLGQVADGREAWLGRVTTKGIYGIVTDGVPRIHGTVQTNGAVTGRMTHARPNVAQTPRVGTPYGEECRACWVAAPGRVLVGCDADGLELRMLGHFMGRWDGGEYANTVVNGRKEDGTDVHSVNQRASGMTTRDGSKTLTYAFLYGAGDFKLGMIAYDDLTQEQRDRFNAKYPSKRARDGAIKRLGAARREGLLGNLPALSQLSEAVKQAVMKRGRLVGLDGRLLHVRSEHAALNTLLQSAGALVMKRAQVLLDKELHPPTGSPFGTVEFVGTIHDEWQIEVEPQYAEEVGKKAADAIRQAGESFGLRCPLKGNYSIGANWYSTH